MAYRERIAGLCNNSNDLSALCLVECSLSYIFQQYNSQLGSADHNGVKEFNNIQQTSQSSLHWRQNSSGLQLKYDYEIMMIWKLNKGKTIVITNQDMCSSVAGILSIFNVSCKIYHYLFFFISIGYRNNPEYTVRYRTSTQQQS